MNFLIGAVVVLACVMAGYLGAGGHLDVLWQPFEFIIIFGAAIGAYVISNPKPVLLGTLKGFGTLLKSPEFDKKAYLELLSVLFTIFKLARSKGDLALEGHIEKPSESDIFSAHPTFVKNHHAVEFTCDYLRLLTLGSANAHEVEAIMDAELEIHEHEAHAVAKAMQGMADGLPALGIVAAVLGVIHTMGSITEPPEVLGHLIGGALVGTFMGVLVSYGFVGPIAKALDRLSGVNGHYLACIKAGIVAHVQGYAPQISVEMARKTVAEHVRPSFQEMDAKLQGN